MPLDIVLYKTARRMQTYFNDYFRSTGIALTFTQFLVLRELWRTSPLSEKDICHRLCLDSGTITPVIKILIKEGYVEKQRGVEDERVVIISITEKGAALRKDIGSPTLPIGEKKAEKMEGLLEELLTELEK